MDGKRILLLGAYSMEVIECGGALLKNVPAGGVSHAAILFAGEQMRRDLSYYMYPGATGHQKLTLSEQYRRESCFELDGLFV